MKYCSECGQPIQDGDRFCRHCGYKMIDSPARWVTGKLVIGILSLLFSLLIISQSYSVMNFSYLNENYAASGFSGIILGVNLFVSSIISIAARKVNGKLPWIICVVLIFLGCLFGCFLSMEYVDLVLFSYMALTIGIFYLISIMKHTLGYLLAIAVIIFWIALCAVARNIGLEGLAVQQAAQVAAGALV